MSAHKNILHAALSKPLHHSIGKYKNVDATSTLFPSYRFREKKHSTHFFFLCLKENECRKFLSYASQRSLKKYLDEVGTVMASSECFNESRRAKKIFQAKRGIFL